jgi:GNAT superfamily N-acetyltransferase
MADDIRIRAIDSTATDAIELIAKRMLLTLIEVLGEERGRSMYTLEEAIQRVMWHLNSDQSMARVFVAENSRDEMVGHTIVRVDDDGEGGDIGLFATTYVVPEVRRAGVAGHLLATGEHWMREQGLPVAATYTEENNTKLQQLYLQRGYSMTAMPKRFVKLAKPLP